MATSVKSPSIVEYLSNESKTPAAIEQQQKFIQQLPASESESRIKALKQIRKYHRAKNLVFVLGAGVSMDFGLPGWDTLLQKLILTTLDNERDVSNVLSKLYTKLFTPSALVAGRYLQHFYDKENRSFSDAVREVLYKDLNIGCVSRLMDEIVQFCASPGNSPPIDCVITYNFDDILEQRINRSNITIPFTSIYGIGMNAKGKLPIYHVHGYLPSNDPLDDQHQITFGESIYHKQYSDIYSWNNMVQINKFRDYNCVFIGSSLTDPNIRRLLDIANRQKGDDNTSHYVFRRRYDKDRIGKRLESLLREETGLLDEKMLAEMEVPQTVDLLSNIVERFDEKDSASLGVKTIWVNSYDEIPDFLEEVRNY